MSDQEDRRDLEQDTSRTAREQPSGPGQEPLDNPDEDRPGEVDSTD